MARGDFVQRPVSTSDRKVAAGKPGTASLYKVVVDQRDGTELGMVVGKNGFVENVSGGLIGAWNKRVPRTDRVRVGDKIVQVNDVKLLNSTSFTEVEAELTMNQMLRMQFRRQGDCLTKSQRVDQDKAMLELRLMARVLMSHNANWGKAAECVSIFRGLVTYCDRVPFLLVVLVS